MRFHTNLPVRDIEQTVAFYRTLFQAEPVKLRKDYAKFLPANQTLNISFHRNPEAIGSLETLHLGFELESQQALDAAFARLSKAGLAETRDTSVCCYANQDKFWVTDPNGYRWEIYYLLADTQEKMSASTGCCVTEQNAAGCAPRDTAGAGACGCG